MQVSRIVAAEEIQLLLPENQPEAEESGHQALFLGLGLLLMALPYCSFRPNGSSRLPTPLH